MGIICPHCQNDRPDERELEGTLEAVKINKRVLVFWCVICSKNWQYEETMNGENGVNLKPGETNGKSD